MDDRLDSERHSIYTNALKTLTLNDEINFDFNTQTLDDFGYKYSEVQSLHQLVAGRLPKQGEINFLKGYRGEDLNIIYNEYIEDKFNERSLSDTINRDPKLRSLVISFIQLTNILQYQQETLDILNESIRIFFGQNDSIIIVDILIKNYTKYSKKTAEDSNAINLIKRIEPELFKHDLILKFGGIISQLEQSWKDCYYRFLFVYSGFTIRERSEAKEILLQVLLDLESQV